MEYQTELDTALEAARAAGRLILAAYETFTAIPDARADITTDVDRQSQETILQCLGRRFPGDALCAEEETPALASAVRLGASAVGRRSHRRHARLRPEERRIFRDDRPDGRGTSGCRRRAGTGGAAADLRGARRRLLAAGRRGPGRLPGHGRVGVDGGHAHPKPIPKIRRTIGACESAASGDTSGRPIRRGSSWRWWPAARPTCTSIPTRPSTTGTSAPGTFWFRRRAAS